jgi:hypothetical protein
MKSIKRKHVGIHNIRFGAMIGMYTFLYKFIAQYLQQKKITTMNGFIAGSIAGLSILLEGENRIEYAQQLCMRACMTMKNIMKTKYKTIPHGDVLLFSLACGSILHAYVFRPDTIPKEYYQWMVAKAKVPIKALEINRTHTRKIQEHGPKTLANEQDIVDYVADAHPNVKAKMLEYLREHKGAMPGIPCSLYHPKTTCCSRHWRGLFLSVCKEMIPVYVCLNAIPVLLLQPRSLLDLIKLQKLAKSVGHSTAFVASYITLFQTGMCLYSKVFPTQSTRYCVYPLGVLLGLVLFLEQKSKRGELVLFTVPKALLSLYCVLCDHGLFHVPGIPVWSTSVSMGVLMSVFQANPKRVQGLLGRFLQYTCSFYFLFLCY